MTPEERQLLTALFERVAATGSPPRDREAEALIADAVRQLPFAPYVLAQTVLVQDQALRAAADRIAELERQAPAPNAPSRLGETRPRTPSGLPGIGAASASPVPAAGPWGQAAAQGQPGGLFGGGGGGGFLSGALTTAAGVAGGALLFQGIQSLFAGREGGATDLFGAQEANAAAEPETSFADRFMGTSERDERPEDDPGLTQAGLDQDEDPDDGFDLGMDDGGDWA